MAGMIVDRGCFSSLVIFILCSWNQELCAAQKHTWKSCAIAMKTGELRGIKQLNEVVYCLVNVLPISSQKTKESIEKERQSPLE